MIANCKECGKPADAQPNEQSESYPICAACMKLGWTSDPKEIQEAFSNDKGFQLGIQSPIQRHDI